ncbi:hypothetical protein ABNH60_003532 [Salmonella enterica]
MKKICIFSPCHYARKTVCSLCYEFVNKYTLHKNNIEIWNFSDIKLFKSFINSERWISIDKVILINGGGFSPVIDIMGEILQFGQKDISFIAGKGYRDFVDSYLWPQELEYIDIDSNIPQFRRSLRGFVQRPVGMKMQNKNKALYLLNHMEISVLHCFLAGLNSRQIQTEMSMPDKTVSYYKRKILKKSGARSLLQFAWLFGTSIPLWMQMHTLKKTNGWYEDLFLGEAVAVLDDDLFH